MFDNHPFGNPASEQEFDILGQNIYESLYLMNRFSDSILNPRCYLVIGRRGSGKTALGKYVEFQTTLPSQFVVDIDEPLVFRDLLEECKPLRNMPREVLIPLVARIWEYVFWSIIFHRLRRLDPSIERACAVSDPSLPTSKVIRGSLGVLFESIVDSEVSGVLESVMFTEEFRAAQTASQAIARTQPVFLIFDTLENVAIHNDAVMTATAALIQAASLFALANSKKNIFVKVFVMAEAFPRLKEEVMLNPLKHISDELYLHWRPKELLRLICRRLWVYLDQSKFQGLPAEPDWNNYDQVKTQIWDLFFSKAVDNRKGHPEETFPYIMRHTQLRPRQLIVVCNHIAREAVGSGSFPYFTRHDIVEGVRLAESSLAEEVFNAYNERYPRAATICRALTGIPVIFKGSDLDRRSKETAGAWPEGEYSQANFISMLAELGAVGRVRHYDKSNGYLAAEFEYFRSDRLTILPETECVLHPMFYSKLEPDRGNSPRVFPFPDHPEFADIAGR